MGKYVNGGGNKRRHVLIAELAIGRTLPRGAIVHHIDGNGRNNSNNNLLICPSENYHQLLHLRQRALFASGNPEFRKCPFCKQWGHPSEMIVVGDTPNRNPRYCHRTCKATYERQRKVKANERILN